MQLRRISTGLRLVFTVVREIVRSDIRRLLRVVRARYETGYSLVERSLTVPRRSPMNGVFEVSTSVQGDDET